MCPYSVINVAALLEVHGRRHLHRAAPLLNPHARLSMQMQGSERLRAPHAARTCWMRGFRSEHTAMRAAVALLTASLLCSSIVVAAAAGADGGGSAKSQLERRQQPLPPQRRRPLPRPPPPPLRKRPVLPPLRRLPPPPMGWISVQVSGYKDRQSLDEAVKVMSSLVRR